MARERMVTRTMQTTKVNVLCMNIKSATPEYKDITLAGTFKDEKSLMKAVEKAINNDTLKAVNVVKSEAIETLYGMSEADFIATAKVLPPRGTVETEPTPDVKNKK